MKYILILLLFPFFASGQLPDSLLTIINYNGLPSQSSIRDIVVTESNTKFVATNKGVFKITDKNLAAEKILEGNFQALCTNKKEDVWAISGNTIYSLNDIVHTFSDLFVANDLEYFRGSLWCATDKGAYKVNLKTKKQTAHYDLSLIHISEPTRPY